MANIAVGRASEDDTARPIAVVGGADQAIPMGRAVEFSEARAWGQPTETGDLSLMVPNPEVVETPMGLDVIVGNGVDGETVVFNLHGPVDDYLALLTVMLDEDGTAYVTIVLPAISAGTYLLEAVGSISNPGYYTLTVTGEPLNEEPDPDDDTLPDEPVPDPDDYRWKFVDELTAETYTMTRNPQRWTNPLIPSTLEHDVTTAPDGAVLAWEGAERSWTFEFSGYIDTQDDYEALEHWASLNRRFWLIDHRHRVRYVTFEQFDARARIVPNKPWAHDYTMRVVHFFATYYEGADDVD